MPKSRPPYPPAFRREAVRMVRSGRLVKDVAAALGVTEQSLRNWVKRDQLDRRECDDGLTSSEWEELRQLRRRVSGLVVGKRGRTTIRVPGVRVADDLVKRQFRPEQPDVLWIADLSYLRTWEGWLYLAAVQDAFSRRIVGWSMADNMRHELVVDALTMAVTRRRREPGLIHHSDQGSQYVSLGFGQACQKAGIARSMGSRGDCWDNAMAETFFATLKKELVYRHSWPTRRELVSEVFEYIEAFYNLRRRHCTLGYLSPAEFDESRRSTV